MIITTDTVTVHPPGQIIDHSMLKEAIGGWLTTGSFFHPIGGSSIIMYCDDEYIRKELPYNPLASALYNHGWEKHHPVLGTVVFTKTVAEGDSAELPKEEIVNLIGCVQGAFPEGTLEKLGEWLKDPKDTFEIKLLNAS